MYLFPFLYFPSSFHSIPIPVLSLSPVLSLTIHSFPFLPFLFLRSPSFPSHPFPSLPIPFLPFLVVLKSATLHQSAAKLVNPFSFVVLFTPTCSHGSFHQNSSLFTSPWAQKRGGIASHVCKWEVGGEAVKYSSCNLESNLGKERKKGKRARRPQK